MALTLGPEIKDNYGTEFFVGRTDSLVYTSGTIYFGIFSGTIPTSAANFLAASSYPYASIDCLMYWQQPPTATYYSIIDNELKLNQNFFTEKFPDRTGTATYFGFWRANGTTKYNAVVGEIGTIGSGAELEMADTVINRHDGVSYTFPGDIRFVAPYPL